MKNLTDFRKTMEAGVDLCLLLWCSVYRELDVYHTMKGQVLNYSKYITSMKQKFLNHYIMILYTCMCFTGLPLASQKLAILMHILYQLLSRPAWFKCHFMLGSINHYLQKKFLMGAQENEYQISQNGSLHMKFSEFYLCFHNSREN